jgi:hypothetical protein
MDRSIGLERVFNLGDYKSLRVSDHANNIPEELALDAEFMDGLRSLQLVGVDRAYYTYATQTLGLAELDTDEKKAELLTTIELDLYTQLVSHMTKIMGQEES